MGDPINVYKGEQYWFLLTGRSSDPHISLQFLTLSQNWHSSSRYGPEAEAKETGFLPSPLL
ncbi:MAG TPA: hypothetical protein DCQ51_21425 [Planktothrix sp. UBA8407]|nr:hypothetical protein [Planktothrix sp. UBA8407]